MPEDDVTPWSAPSGPSSPFDDEWAPTAPSDPFAAAQPAGDPGARDLPGPETAVPRAAFAGDAAVPAAAGPVSPPDAADLLRRAALGATPPSADGAGDVVGAKGWECPAALAQLRTLVRVGVATLVCAVVVVPYWLTDGLHSHPGLIMIMTGLGFVMASGLILLFVIGLVATLGRRSYGVLLLGLVLSPLVYALWAWSVLAQLKQPADDR